MKSVRISVLKSRFTIKFSMVKRLHFILFCVFLFGANDQHRFYLSLIASTGFFLAMPRTGRKLARKATATLMASIKRI